MTTGVGGEGPGVYIGSGGSCQVLRHQCIGVGGGGRWVGY